LKTVTATVSDPVGFHLRAAGRIVKLTKTFTSEVTIRYNGRAANAKSIMGLASLAAEFGTDVEIEIEGAEGIGLPLWVGIAVGIGLPLILRRRYPGEVLVIVALVLGFVLDFAF
jgi:phosphocarrier protein HPr